MTVVKCSSTNFSNEISLPFETKSHPLLTERALLISSCTCWKQSDDCEHLLPPGLGVGTHYSEGALWYLGGFRTQEVNAHLPTAFAQASNTVWILAPFLKVSLTRKGARFGLEEPSECLPRDRLVPQPIAHRLASFSFSCHKVGCPCGGDRSRCFMRLIPFHQSHHPVPHRFPRLIHCPDVIKMSVSAVLTREVFPP